MAQDATPRADVEAVFRKIPLDLTTQPESVFGATYEAIYEVEVEDHVVGRVVRRRTPTRAAARPNRSWRALLLIDGEWRDLDGWYASRTDAYAALRAQRDAA